MAKEFLRFFSLPLDNEHPIQRKGFELRKILFKL
jgi:hypothetical protein